MFLRSFDVENDLRRQYNRRVLFCIRVKGAALLIGLWDLFIHVIALGVLIIMFRSTPQEVNNVGFHTGQLGHPSSPIGIEPFSDTSSGDLLQQKNFISSNILLNRILEKRNLSRLSAPPTPPVRSFYSNLDLITLKWAASLNQQDRCVVFFIIFSATILIFAHIYGILTNKPSYIVPYFLIKVFNVIVSILSMLGFYAYLPDMTVWLRLQPDFPLKKNLLELDVQTLQLVVFAFLLFMILAKLYIAAIIWYCYGYVTALNMARNIAANPFHADISRTTIGEMYSPPKYEEAIQSNQHEQENNAPPPYTPLLQGTV